ncbi:MAG: small multi-drug export protein [Candidatus Iainarchaeum sp.]|jgi:uncharacterized membrane protein|nr:MAG: putative small multi-drug export protein [archaeon ADurb.Bin336]
MFEKILILIILSWVPVFELRWSIPIGLFSGVIEGVPLVGSMQGFALPLEIVFLVCVGANIILGFLAYFFFDKIIFIFLKVPILKKFYDKIVVRAQKKAYPLVEKYGLIGMSIFIAIPLPGSGSWTGALVGNLLNFGYKRFFIANAIGIIIAGLIVTVISTGAFSLFGF